MEQNVKSLLGEYAFMICNLQAQLQAAQAQIDKLKEINEK